MITTNGRIEGSFEWGVADTAYEEHQQTKYTVLTSRCARECVGRRHALPRGILSALLAGIFETGKHLFLLIALWKSGNLHSRLERLLLALVIAFFWMAVCRQARPVLPDGCVAPRSLHNSSICTRTQREHWGLWFVLEACAKYGSVRTRTVSNLEYGTRVQKAVVLCLFVFMARHTKISPLWFASC